MAYGALGSTVLPSVRPVEPSGSAPAIEVRGLYKRFGKTQALSVPSRCRGDRSWGSSVLLLFE